CYGEICFSDQEFTEAVMASAPHVHREHAMSTPCGVPMGTTVMLSDAEIKDPKNEEERKGKSAVRELEENAHREKGWGSDVTPHAIPNKEAEPDREQILPSQTKRFAVTGLWWKGRR